MGQKGLTSPWGQVPKRSPGSEHKQRHSTNPCQGVPSSCHLILIHAGCKPEGQGRWLQHRSCVCGTG